MKSPKNGGDKSHLVNYCHQMKFSVPGLGYFNCTWGQTNPQTTKTVATILGCIPQFDRKAPLPKTIPTQLNEHGNKLPKEKRKHQPSHKTFRL